MRRVVAIVVARGGSKRLPGKALLPFGDSTLIGHKVQQLCSCSLIDGVVVGSDSPDILLEAERHGAEIIKRDDYHCDEEQCTANEMIYDMVRRVRAEIIVWAHPTNPLVRTETYDVALETFLRAPRYMDSLVSVTVERRHAWFGGKPLNHQPWGDGPHVPAAQLVPVLYQNGAIFIQPREQMLSNRSFYGRRPITFEIYPQEAVDIDTEADYRLALALREVQEVSVGV